jgi:hypothetical protein
MATFIDLLRKLGIPYKRHGESGKVTTGWAGLPCPFCRHVARDGDPNLLGISPTGAVTCWLCGPHSQVDTLAALTGRTPGQCARQLKEFYAAGGLPPPPATTHAPAGRLALPRGIGGLLAPHRKYLKSRGFDPDELVQVWKLRGLGIAGDLSWRLFIPIEQAGEVVSWTTRSIDPNARRRYVSAPQEAEKVPAKHCLYGGDLCGHGVVICEGPADAWAVGPGGISLLGTGYSNVQVSRLAAHAVRAVVFDREPAARGRACRLATRLTSLPGVTEVVTLEHGADPADCLLTAAGRRELRAIRKRYLE